MNRIIFSIILFNLIICASCSPFKNSLKELKIESNYCTPSYEYFYDSTNVPSSTESVHASPLYNKYPLHLLLTANAAGVLKDWEHLEQHKSINMEDAEYLKLEQLIITKLFLASNQISSTAAELDCEGERAEQLSHYVDEHETKRVRLLTVLSITTAAVSGVITSAADRSTTTEIIGIAGGALSATFGLLILVTKNKIKFNHERNLLSDIWYENKSSKYYPPSLWYMFHEKLFSNSKDASIANHIKDRWKILGNLGTGNSKKSKQRQKLFFGNGGWYTREELNSRSAMLNQMQAAVRLFHQDLQGLILVFSH